MSKYGGGAKVKSERDRQKSRAEEIKIRVDMIIGQKLIKNK